MGTVRLWLSVYEKLCPMGSYTLWTKELTTDFPPREGDDVHLWPDEDGESSVNWSVRRHYWSWDGRYSCELTHLVVDPAENNYTTRPGRENYLYARPWHTDVNNRPEPGLRRGGWITREEYHNKE